ncbi:hypothetical protein [Gloeothece verrucosa]|uniref:Uncharacterized protein n=1 Tax=Gloeothece verrucosa (strain PCC 7822) TaxID=497965 RepID=E0UNM8_GLOV7|nr:hypothetical protein [Gloeothece verrucosa]ADN18558.1 hypothetical protein Cyan7822_6917 [Gloeothece verrucosa PCC 7822]
MKAPALTLFVQSSLSLIGFMFLFSLLGAFMNPQQPSIKTSLSSSPTTVLAQHL